MYLMEQGITFYDTAELYGKGKSEEILGGLHAKYADRFKDHPTQIASKYLPLPWRYSKNRINMEECKKEEEEGNEEEDGEYDSEDEAPFYEDERGEWWHGFQFPAEKHNSEPPEREVYCRGKYLID